MSIAASESEQFVLAKLEELIRHLGPEDDRPQEINIVGILIEIDGLVLKPEGNEPDFEGQPPQVYLDIKAYCDRQREVFDRHTASCDNLHGSLLALQAIQDKYRK